MAQLQLQQKTWLAPSCTKGSARVFGRPIQDLKNFVRLDSPALNPVRCLPPGQKGACGILDVSLGGFAFIDRNGLKKSVDNDALRQAIARMTRLTNRLKNGRIADE